MVKSREFWKIVQGFEFLRLAGMLLTSHTLYINVLRIMLLSSVLCSRQFFQVNKAPLQRTSSTIILLMFENVVNHILFELLVFLFFLNRLIFSHVGRYLEFLELLKGNNSTPTWILLYTSKRYIIHRKKNFIRQNRVCQINGLWLLD